MGEGVCIESRNREEPKLLAVSYVGLGDALGDVTVRRQKQVSGLDVHDHLSGGILETGVNDLFLYANRIGSGVRIQANPWILVGQLASDEPSNILRALET